MSSDGSEQRALAHANPIRHAVWSPDGSRIALYDSSSISTVSRDGTDLRVPCGGGPQRLAPASAIHPARSHHGSGNKLTGVRAH